MKINTLILTCAIVICSFFSVSAQEKSGEIYFIRSTNNVGGVVAYKVYIDDQLVCHLKNKHYSVHDIAPGEHTVSIQNTGLASHKKSRPMKITVVKGKINYLVAVNGPELYLQEAVESSAQTLLKKVVLTQKCLPAAK